MVAQRPERDLGRGSDVLWSTGMQAFAVIEAKSGATGQLIWKKDINQLAGSALARDSWGGAAADASMVAGWPSSPPTPTRSPTPTPTPPTRSPSTRSRKGGFADRRPA